ncbi:carbohydrate-binding protein [Aquimarina agarivorans]|uniref:carbohydrate-binding protein n=1 Tax=Aquimarina agarivorans TaxID=980584 RepID=UPI000248FB35|nr:carbohydrate-binding protein [Aquimarina agarivorans]
MIRHAQLNFKGIVTVAFLCNFFFLAAKDIYVSKSGNDSNDGSQASPYLTINKAAQQAKAGDTVIIESGTYFETIRPVNSGNAGNPIIFKGKEGDKVIISAMQSLQNWELDAGSIYKTTVDWDLKDYNMLMNNGVVMDLARWPNNTDGNPFSLNSVRSEGGSDSSNLNNAFLLNKEIPNVDWTGGNIMFYGDRGGSGWTTWREYITGGSTGRVNFTVNKSADWIIAAHPPADGGDFFLEGVKGVLDYQNEWWFNSNSKTLYVQVLGGNKPNDGQIAMRQRQMTVNLNKRNYIEIQNLAVLGGRIEIDGTGNRIYKVSSFHGDYYRGVAQSFIADCRNVMVKWNAKNNIIEQCEIAYGAGSGIYDQGNGTKIINNYIHDFDYLGDYNAPVLARGASNCLLSKNTIKNGGRDAIQIITKNSTVEYNDVSKSNLIADDCALIYTIGEDLNMEIHHNWFHDAESRGKLKKAAGIYLDNDAGKVNVYRNVVWNTEWTSVQINWNGTDINVYNNSFAKNIATMGAWHKAGTMFSNVNVWNNITDKEGSSAGGQEEEATWEPQSDKQNNLVDQESYVNWEGNNFQLKPNAKAVDFGRIIPGYTDGFKGSNPDVGAYELGDNWVPGVEWDLKKGPSGNGCYNILGEECEIAFQTIPGKIEAEDFIKQNGMQIEPTEDVGGGLNVGFIGANDFVEYAVSVAETGAYKFNFRVASDTNGGTIVIMSNNVVLENLNVGNTGGWQEWTTVDKEITLNEGDQNLKFVFEGESQFLLNLNYIDINLSSTLSISNFEALSAEIYPNPATNFVTINLKKKELSLSVYDLSGKLILSSYFENENNEINISNLDRGMYLLCDKDSGASFKLIKQ